MRKNVIPIAAFEEHRSTSRVLDVLELLAGADEAGYTLTELAERIGAPKSSLFPLVHTLRTRRFLQLDEGTGRYTIGLAAFAVGTVFLNSHSLMEHIRNEMRSVALRCNEICQMGVPDGTQVLYVMKEDSPNPIQLISHVGKRLPMYCTSLGKAILMGYSQAQLEGLFPDSSSLRPMTPNTIVNRDQLFRQLEEMRATGFASELAESNESICCQAVPLTLEGRTVAALSVSIPLFRCDDEKIALARQCLSEAKQNIEALLPQPDMAREFKSFLEQR